jgi:magnesium chelatase subunit I
MTDQIPSTADNQEEPAPQVSSLKELIERVSGKGLPMPGGETDGGIADLPPYPFLAIVGQKEMKLALLLSLVNPNVGGVLLVGPRGTGKTTAVRALADLLPQTPRSLCYYGCMPEDIEVGGMSAVCPECAAKFALGEPLAAMDRVRLVELPLNAALEDVVGGVDDRAAIHDRLRLRRGILAQADRNLLYIDEVNLLDDQVADATLDAAAQGSYTVRRGPVSASYRARFVLIGSMNPEEGRLRPQIMDRFGLRVLVRGLMRTASTDIAAGSLEVYRRVRDYQDSPRRLAAAWAEDTALAREEIQAACEALYRVGISPEVARQGLELVHDLGIDSQRAGIVLLEAARAHAAIDGRIDTCPEDLLAVAPMALRLRRSSFMDEFFARQDIEESELEQKIGERLTARPTE